jgi:heat shock protein HtpX
MILSIFASIILMRYSRQREFRADAGAARYVGTQHMIDALRTLGTFHQKKSKQDAFAMMKISGGKTWMNIFRSHPSMEKRIDALQNLQYN